MLCPPVMMHVATFPTILPQPGSRTREGGTRGATRPHLCTPTVASKCLRDRHRGSSLKCYQSWVHKAKWRDLTGCGFPPSQNSSFANRYYVLHSWTSKLVCCAYTSCWIKLLHAPKAPLMSRRCANKALTNENSSMRGRPEWLCLRMYVRNGPPPSYDYEFRGAADDSSLRGSKEH
ncbi:hypothetical protein GQ53DRAFT_516797 [Thozetella sp. PMI_491]|nr:hypothetical protein GQ53DRAFT_516797 [Thozetella sp. PMI_491]